MKKKDKPIIKSRISKKFQVGIVELCIWLTNLIGRDKEGSISLCIFNLRQTRKMWREIKNKVGARIWEYDDTNF